MRFANRELDLHYEETYLPLVKAQYASYMEREEPYLRLGAAERQYWEEKCPVMDQRSRATLIPKARERMVARCQRFAEMYEEYERQRKKHNRNWHNRNYQKDPDALFAKWEPLFRVKAFKRGSLLNPLACLESGKEPRGQVDLKFLCIDLDDVRHAAMRIHELACGWLLEELSGIFQGQELFAPSGSWGVFEQSLDLAKSIKRMEKVIRKQAKKHIDLGTRVARFDGDNQISKFWRELRSAIDELEWFIPEPDDALLAMPEIPAPPMNFEAVRKWGDERLLPARGWEALYQRLCSEEHDPLHQRMLIGTDPSRTIPVFLSRADLRENHVYIWGRSGSAKTSAAIAPLLVQLIRGSDETDARSGVFGKPAPLLVVDLKGDRALYHTVRLEAQARGQTFRLLSTEPDVETDLFDAFGSLAHLSDAEQQLAECLAAALELEHGAGYGADHFSICNANVLGRALSHSSKPRTLGDLARVLSSMQSKSRDAEDAKQVIEMLSRRPHGPVLDVPPGAPEESVIDMQRVVRDREVVYVLAPLEGGRSTSTIARLALWCFQLAVSQHNRNARSPVRAYVVADEAHELAGYNVGRLMAQARSLGTTLILANQDPSQLDGVRQGISRIVLGQSGIQICLSVETEETLDHLSRMSGTTEVLHRLETGGSSFVVSRTTSSGSSLSVGESSTWGSSTLKSWSSSMGMNESFGPYGFIGLHSFNATEGGGLNLSQGGASSVGRTTSTGTSFGEAEGQFSGFRTEREVRQVLDDNDLLDASARPQVAVVRVKGDPSSLGRPYVVQLLFAMPEEEYKRRMRAPWPAKSRSELPQAEGGQSTPAACQDFDERIRALAQDDVDDERDWST
ncbi:MAG: TraM recognition domain-containing protein [Planctomycetota bacterium]